MAKSINHSILSLSRDLLASACLVLILNIPSLAFERVDLVEIKGDVRIGRGKNWSTIPSSKQYLLKEEWVRSGDRSGLNLFLKLRSTGSRKTGYFQGVRTETQFAPTKKCKLHLAQGEVVYLHKGPAPDSACETITPSATTRSSGTALYIIHDKTQGTTVGVLTKDSGVTVTSNRTGERILLGVGKEVNITIDGEISTPIDINLRAFYQNNRLTLGLGPTQEDINYIRQQPRDIQEMLFAVREETVKAIPISGPESDLNSPGPEGSPSNNVGPDDPLPGTVDLNGTTAPLEDQNLDGTTAPLE
ncbi:hypothetical protein [Acaryochloris sp. IP29b_bin.137]|uniref:hypothetical protein n=1 Tax=Acaryochloris sp. IP29b_bin.137 TaxID=2969217 RepID=UPI00261D83E1|nr:hypothetical protein [Acaryochloris sp. IP29b_bin.137]